MNSRTFAPVAGIVLSVLLSGAVPAAAALTVPNPWPHPRIWWTPARLTQARAWYTTHTFTPRSDDPLGNALRYVLTGETSYADIAITALMDFTMTDQELYVSVASDKYRRDGDWVPWVYDWCYDRMTDEQRTTFRDRYSGYVEAMRLKAWGGPGMQTNNYFWGYFRNELSWAMAIYDEDRTKALDFIDTALAQRWNGPGGVVPWAQGEGRGGVLQEGFQYGSYQAGYPIIPFRTMALNGQNLFDETSFFKETVYYLIYSLTNAPTAKKAATGTYYQMMPFGDDEVSDGYPDVAASQNLGDFMTQMAELYQGQPVGQYRRRWLNVVGPVTSRHVAATAAAPGTALAFDALPLDYFASGPAFAFWHSSWAADASQAYLQLGPAGDSSHAHDHADVGTFHLWRKGRWLAKESTGYSQNFVDATDAETKVHNGLLVNGLGGRPHTDMPSRMLRLESRPAYAYAAADITGSYTTNPIPVNSVVREFLFIRPLDTLVILDRVKSKNASYPVTALVHTPESIAVTGSSALAVNGNQALKVTSLYPAGASLNVVDEGAGTTVHAAQKQFRLEITASGQTDTLLLTVLQARDQTGADLSLSLTEDAGQITLTLSHPTQGNAVAQFQKGMASAGGQFGYAASGSPALSALRSDIQGFSVTDQGPVWQQSGPPDTTPPARPRGLRKR